jgi:hypothetical protein
VRHGGGAQPPRPQLDARSGLQSARWRPATGTSAC